MPAAAGTLLSFLVLVPFQNTAQGSLSSQTLLIPSTRLCAGMKTEIAATMLSHRDNPSLGKPQFASHSWAEPIVVLSIMIGSLILNRRRGYSITDPKQTKTEDAYDDEISYRPLSPNDRLFASAYDLQDSDTQRVCGITTTATGSTRWNDHIHSRILQRFPFLVEMFYWAVNYFFYSVTKATAEWLAPAQVEVVQVARDHGISIIGFEQQSAFRFLFPIRESVFQQFFIHNHHSAMSFFNRVYSLVHIPGTVLSFFSWYYYSAPDFNTFAIVRRTMTLGNFAAFVIFCLWPCMPPRLLPESYQFFDTVRQEHAESIWVNSKSVNQFAAMPSLHFTYAFVAGCTFFYHSGMLHRLRGKPSRKPVRTQLFFAMLAIAYPVLVLTIIVATANHYWLDAVLAMFTVTLYYFNNRALLLLIPVEYCICWALRLAKPTPTTGYRLTAQDGGDNVDYESDIEYRHA